MLAVPTNNNYPDRNDQGKVEKLKKKKKSHSRGIIKPGKKEIRF